MSKWISVDERLPEEQDRWCLVYADGAINCMMLGKRAFYDPTHARCHNIIPASITHWMPLPEPPVTQ